MKIISYPQKIKRIVQLICIAGSSGRRWPDVLGGCTTHAPGTTAANCYATSFRLQEIL
jgi:hypothetical protein